MKFCSVYGCDAKHKARGWCSRHWTRWWRHGDPLGGGPEQFATPEQAFAARTQHDPSSGCLLWTGGTDDHGYGWIRCDGKNIRAHRYSWKRKHGPVPDGMHVLHHCDTPPCCEEQHLFIGTRSDNMVDMVAKGRSSAKLTLSDVRLIRRDTRLQRIIAGEYGLTQANVSAIKLRQSWRHVT